MKTLKVGDRLTRNNLPLGLGEFATDPRKIKLIAVSSVRNGDFINGFKIQDMFTGKVEDASTEYIKHYYELDQRKEKLNKINELQDR